MNTKSLAKWTLAAVVASAAVYLTSASFSAETPAGAPRTMAQILTDMDATQNQLSTVMKPVNEMFDSKVRAQVAVQAIPLVKKNLTLMDELNKNIDPEKILHAKIQVLLIGAFLDDADMEKQLTAISHSTNAEVALEAQLSLTTIQWWKSHADPAAQSKILDQVEILAKASPNEDTLADTLSTLENTGAATPDLAKRAHAIILSDLKGPEARNIQAAPVIGDPMELNGVTVDGKTFDTAAWKGKVIVVDFWATWCPTCIAELPDMKKVYQKYHDQGLEFLGVSSDFEGAKLKNFLLKNEIPWPQLWDASRQTSEDAMMHAYVQKYHLDAAGLPAVFIIDRHGNLQFADHGEDLETRVKQLLEDKPAPASPK